MAVEVPIYGRPADAQLTRGFGYIASRTVDGSLDEDLFGLLEIEGQVVGR